MRSAPKLPAFRGENGIMYPAAARLLRAATLFTLPRFCNWSATAVDIYISAFLLSELLLITLFALEVIVPGGAGYAAWACATVAIVRLADLISVNASEFLLGYYRDREPWSINRGILLKVVNIVELIVLYGIVFYVFEAMFSDSIARMSNSFDSIGDAVFFSAVTAATLGYGELWLSAIHVDSCGRG